MTDYREPCLLFVPSNNLASGEPAQAAMSSGGGGCVGILANPMSGRDVRRVAARASRLSRLAP